MTSSRTEFLSKFWKPYPAVTESALDISGAFSFLEIDKLVLVGGRLLGHPREFTLSSGGETCAVQFDANCKWIDAATSFSSEVLKSGDIVLVRAKVAGIFDSVVLHVCEVQLLAPSFAVEKHNTSAEVSLLNQWSEYLQAVRLFFLENQFVECQTPTLVPSPGTEPYLDVFTTNFIHGRTKRTYFLPTSPEFHLKKLLARGHTRIFEMKSCFRNGEVSEHHQPEFQMLEWYRAYAGLDSIIEDLRKLMLDLQNVFPQKKIEALKVTTMAELFAKHANGFVLRPDSSREELYQLCVRLGLNPKNDDTWDDLFFRVVIEKIEPALDKEIPTIVRGYPKPQAALARLSSEGWAERFEFYWQGFEIANAFDELNDPKQNEERFKSDLQKRIQSGREAHPIDNELVESFYSGMPPAGGIALGLERLFMALTGVKDISQIKPFAISLY